MREFQDGLLLGVVNPMPATSLLLIHHFSSFIRTPCACHLLSQVALNPGVGFSSGFLEQSASTSQLGLWHKACVQ